MLSPALILEVGQAILAADGPESTVSIIIDAAIRLAGAEMAGLIQVDPGSGLLRCVQAAGKHAEQMMTLAPFPRTHGIAGRAIKTGRPVWLTDLLHDDDILVTPEMRAAFSGRPRFSVIAAPLLSKDEATAALVAFRLGADAFSPAQIELMTALASLAGVALETSRLKQKTLAQSHRARVVADMARIVSSSLSLPDLLGALLREVQRMVPCVLGSFAFHNSAAHTISYYAMDASGGPSASSVATENADGTVAWSVIQSRQSQIIGDYRLSPVTHHADRVKKGLLSSVCVPIVSDGECLGVLNLVSDRAHAFTADHVAYIEELTPHLAVAIEKTRLFEQATARALRMTRLAELSRLVSETLDVQKVQRFVTKVACDLLGADVPASSSWTSDGATHSPGRCHYR